jgi:purine nucleosidase
MRPFLIDTDTASDDAVAIIMALSAPDVRVLALTTVASNVAVDQATRNALFTAEICSSDVPVFKGAGAPLVRALEDAHQFHGADGLGDHGYPAPRREPRLAEEYPG